MPIQMMADLMRENGYRSPATPRSLVHCSNKRGIVQNVSLALVNNCSGIWNVCPSHLKARLYSNCFEDKVDDFCCTIRVSVLLRKIGAVHLLRYWHRDIIKSLSTVIHHAKHDNKKEIFKHI